MRFDIEHTLAATVVEVSEALLDPGFQESLGDLEALRSRTVLAQEEEADGRVVRRVRCVLDIDLGAARRFVGDSEPAWVEEAIWDPAALRWEWEIHPEVAADLLRAAGAVELAPKGDETARRVAGDVRVRVPLYGSRVETWIVEGLTRAYDEEAARLARWLSVSREHE